MKLDLDRLIDTFDLSESSYLKIAPYFGIFLGRFEPILTYHNLVNKVYENNSLSFKSFMDRKRSSEQLKTALMTLLYHKTYSPKEVFEEDNYPPESLCIYNIWTEFLYFGERLDLPKMDKEILSRLKELNKISINTLINDYLKWVS